MKRHLERVCELRSPGESMLEKPTLTYIRRLVADALAEDLGHGDVSGCIFGKEVRARGTFLAKQPGVLSGIDVARMVFEKLGGRGVQFHTLKDNGESFAAGNELARVTAPLPVLLAGERVSLNFLQQLSGVATLTCQFVARLGSSRVGVFDTRKTVPLLRRLQKRAVVHGGGRNHRFGLDDMAMLKNNHIDAAGGMDAAVAALRDRGFFRRKPQLQLCIEARNTNEAISAMRLGADIVMLDNMTPAQIRRAVERLERVAKAEQHAMPQIEVSGGITLKTIAKLRDLPIDRVSVGAITHSAPAVDISFRISRL